ncbi:radical SAM protein [Desulfovibrio caledoniensis]
MGIFITPEWPYCSYPIAIEPYHICNYGCKYCFTKHKESWHNKAKKRKERGFDASKDVFDISTVEKLIHGFEPTNRDSRSLKYFLDRRIAVQIGAQTEPCGILEQKYKSTLNLIKLFRTGGNNYPIRISTKGLELGKEEYLEALESYSKASVLISLISMDSATLKLIEPLTPSPEERLNLGLALSHTKVNLGLRLRPIIPNFSEKTFGALLEKAKEYGFQWVTVEWLRVPRTLTIQTKANYDHISEAIGFDVIEYYHNNSDLKHNRNGYLRLNQQVTQKTYEQLVKLCKKYRLDISSCNKDFREYETSTPNCCGLPLSDKSWSRMQISYAVHVAKENGIVTFSDICNEDSPLNFIINRDNCKRNVYDTTYAESLKNIWSNESHRFYPASFFPELSFLSIDTNGDHIFKYEPILEA